MTIRLRFEGWFQCRLATDPDPSDEPRGVSGYIRAVAGEPDLDRIIRLQPQGATQRSYCPAIGVKVVGVMGDPRHSVQHPLIGAKVDLLDSPKFEGRNHAAAQDGSEAVLPFHIQIIKDRFMLQRCFSDTMKYPPQSDDDRNGFAQLQSTGVNMSPGAIADATGIPDIAQVWAERVRALTVDRDGTSDDIVRTAATARISSMTEMDSRGPVNAKFVGARMLYFVRLMGTAVTVDPDSYLPGAVLASPTIPWIVDLWFGAWDADALSGYTVGYLSVPTGAPATVQLQDIASMTTRESRRR